MRISKLMLPTLREVPAEAEVISHQLLLRAGMMRKSATGVYTLLPLAWRIIRKIEQIIREEMDSAGGQEIMMPIIQPAELWLESGRWNVYGPELFRFKDRHGRDFCLGPTHEELITTLVKGEVNSYKQLPLLLYQMQNKYRDERRPRFGLMRGREFIMKDLYSFDRDEAGLDISYQKMYDAYNNIFRRCGLQFRPVEADSGAIGGSGSHEFMVLAESGEATVLYCTNEECNYAANQEQTESILTEQLTTEALQELQKIDTPDCRTVHEVTAFLNVSAQRLIKTIIYKTDKEIVAALVRGDREINEVKLYNALNCVTLDLADEQIVQQVTGAPVGYAGPVNLSGVKLVADNEVMNMVNAVCGANQGDAHLINLNPQRDIKPDLIKDLRLVKNGEPCPHCGAELREAKGIEVGQVFKLGTKYSKALGATFLDENGKATHYVMGCYGIGVTRTMASSVEQNYDERGIIWPVQIAPYEVIVVPISNKDEALMEAAEAIYNALCQAGVETVIDDRPERAGVKFNDADLIGYPLRITIGAKGLAKGEVEITLRHNGETIMAPVDQAVVVIKEQLQILYDQSR